VEQRGLKPGAHAHAEQAAVHRIVVVVDAAIEAAIDLGIHGKPLAGAPLVAKGQNACGSGGTALDVVALVMVMVVKFLGGHGEAESDGRSFSAVRPFAFRILPFNESVLQEKLHKRFGADGSAASPLTDDYGEIEAFIRMLGTEEAVLDPEVNISLRKKLIYVKEDEGVSAFACILIYQ